MGRQQFTNRNNIGQVLTFQKSGSTSSFDPVVAFSSGSRRVSWRLDNGTNITQTAGNSIIYTGFTSDSTIRTIEMRGNSFRNINAFEFPNDNLYGNLDLTSIPELGGGLRVESNINLTGITHSPSSKIFTFYSAHGCNLTGNFDLTPLSGLGGVFWVYNNSGLTGITHSVSSQNFSSYYAYQCNLTGNLDLTPLSGLGGGFRVYQNSGLTSITHSVSSQIFSSYEADRCNLTGNLNLPFSGLGGVVELYNNFNLTGITHTPSSINFTRYRANSCNLTGNLDLTPLSGLGGVFSLSSNQNLTGITHSPSSQIFTQYTVVACNLQGNLDLTGFSGLSGQLWFFQTSALTAVTHTICTGTTFQYLIHNCNITGTLDLTKFTNLGSSNSGSSSFITTYFNPNLTNILFTTSNNFFRNNQNTQEGRCFAFYNCNLDYIDFKPLSGATLVSGVTVGPPGILLQNNGMSTTDVNHILVDFSGNATFNPSGWSNVNLNISGTNGAPDSGTGGYDGIAARNFLTGSPYNWTITHS